MSDDDPSRCAWCGRDIQQVAIGRRRLYCPSPGRACRQLAHEKQREVARAKAEADRLEAAVAAARASVLSGDKTEASPDKTAEASPDKTEASPDKTAGVLPWVVQATITGKRRS